MATEKEPEKLQVKLELNHKASYRDKPTPEGFTHDWKVTVRGPNGSKIENFVEKVVFYLHESFKKPKRAVKEPPYSIAESGYAGFTLPIDVCFRNKDEPKKIQFYYDLFLHAQGCPPVNNTRCEKLTFENPTPEFRSKLLKAGAYILDNDTISTPKASSPDVDIDVSEPKPAKASSAPRNYISDGKKIPAEAKKSPDVKKSKESVGESKKTSSEKKISESKKNTDKSEVKKTSEVKKPPPVSKADQKFSELFGAPIKSSDTNWGKDSRKSSSQCTTKDSKDKKSSSSKSDKELKEPSKHSSTKLTPDRNKNENKKEKDTGSSSHKSSSATYQNSSRSSMGGKEKDREKSVAKDSKDNSSKDKSSHSASSGKDKHHSSSSYGHSKHKGENSERKRNDSGESNRSESRTSSHSTSKKSMKSEKSKTEREKDKHKEKQEKRNEKTDDRYKDKKEKENEKSKEKEKRDDKKSRDVKSRSNESLARSSSKDSIVSKLSEKNEKSSESKSKSSNSSGTKKKEAIKLSDKKTPSAKVESKDTKSKNDKPKHREPSPKKSPARSRSPKVSSKSPKAKAEVKEEPKKAKPMVGLESLFSTGENSDEDPFEDHRNTSSDSDSQSDGEVMNAMRTKFSAAPLKRDLLFTDSGSDSPSPVTTEPFKTSVPDRSLKREDTRGFSPDSDRKSRSSTPERKPVTTSKPEDKPKVKLDVKRSLSTSSDEVKVKDEHSPKKRPIKELKSEIAEKRPSSRASDDSRHKHSPIHIPINSKSKGSPRADPRLKNSPRVLESLNQSPAKVRKLSEDSDDDITKTGTKFSPAHRRSIDIKQELMVSDSDDADSESEHESKPRVKARESDVNVEEEEKSVEFTEDYLIELVKIQEKLMSSRDRDLVQKVVDLVGETNCFNIDVSFNFDLCSLDKSTVHRIRDLLQCAP